MSLVRVSPTNGTANISGTNVVFTPATNFLGTAFVGYSITDGNGGTNSALITISVTNRPPVAVNDSASAPENVAVTVPVLANDADPDGDALAIVSVSPTNGTAVISGTNVVFTPATNFLGTATAGYIITDGFGGTNSALITISVTNIPPVANPDSYSVTENTTNTLSPLVNDLVVTPGGSVAIVAVSPTNGTAGISRHECHLHAGAEFCGHGDDRLHDHGQHRRHEQFAHHRHGDEHSAGGEPGQLQREREQHEHVQPAGE